MLVLPHNENYEPLQMDEFSHWIHVLTHFGQDISLVHLKRTKYSQVDRSLSHYMAYGIHYVYIYICIYIYIIYIYIFTYIEWICTYVLYIYIITHYTHGSISRLRHFRFRSPGTAAGGADRIPSAPGRCLPGHERHDCVAVFGAAKRGWF